MPVWFIVLIILEFAWLGYETKWLTIRLPKGASNKEPLSCPWLAGVWFNEFKFYRPDCNTIFFPIVYDYGEPPAKTGFVFQTQYNRHPNARHDCWVIELSVGILDSGNGLLCGKDWLNKHWADLNDYHPKVELCFGNGYKQTFTLKKPELIRQIVKINTGKQYFKQLAKRGLK